MLKIIIPLALVAGLAWSHGDRPDPAGDAQARPAAADPQPCGTTSTHSTDGPISAPGEPQQPVAKVIPRRAALLTPRASLPDLDESTDSPAIQRLARDMISTAPHESTFTTGCQPTSAQAKRSAKAALKELLGMTSGVMCETCPPTKEPCSIKVTFVDPRNVNTPVTGTGPYTSTATYDGDYKVECKPCRR